MRVLIVGLGSIGKRNLSSCLRVRPNFNYAVWRQKSSVPASLPGQVLEFFEFAEVEKFKPDLVFVCNPTSFHFETVQKLSSFQPAFFIEKPLSHDKEQVQKIKSLLMECHSPFFYGCLLRQHPLIQQVSSIIQEGILGKPLSYLIRAGSYLPDWRPGQDYRRVYSAQKDLGGGVSLDLIHEFDYAEFWFGKILSIIGINTRLSSLEIDTNDFCAATTRHESGVVGQVQLDYFRIEVRRDFELVFESGVLQGDLVTGVLKVLQKTGPGQILRKEESLSCTRDELHDLQSELIFEVLEKKRAPCWNISDSSRLVEKILDMKAE